MTEIILISRFGKKKLEPFSVNTAEAMPEENQIINSDGCDTDNSESAKVGEQSGN